ncbi:helix-turn-helix domain-containing protein [Parapedobacter tibetensis]|uniref:helix-turn-helix domain-containing protein n=1 Tax=Parapedobacter tibetensis TaxID=2972951 RepID=UPI00214D73FD|nr:helix-turn-helix transcriptional regulator [Parapedobacter tibetensis]
MKNENFEHEEVHLGHNVQRIREITGMKQYELGQRCNGWSQQQISKLEQSEFIDDANIAILAAGLGVTPEFVKNFKEEKVVYNIQSNNSLHDASTQHYRSTINNEVPKKLLELFDKFLEEDRAKTESIANLSKAVLDLAEEVKKLKKEN